MAILATSSVHACVVQDTLREEIKHVKEKVEDHWSVLRMTIVYLMGVVSWRIRCTRKGRYGVYADMMDLKYWVQEIINNYS